RALESAARQSAAAPRGTRGGGPRRRQRRRVTRRVDLLAVDEVPEGTMKMAFVDETDQAIVVHPGGGILALEGICTHEYFELDKGFLPGGGSRGANRQPAGTLTFALHLSPFDLGDGQAPEPPRPP